MEGARHDGNRSSSQVLAQELEGAGLYLERLARGRRASKSPRSENGQDCKMGGQSLSDAQVSRRCNRIVKWSAHASLDGFGRPMASANVSHPGRTVRPAT